MPNIQQESGPPKRVVRSIVPRNVTVSGRRTSIRLEPLYWEAIETLCLRDGISINAMCNKAIQNSTLNITAAIRSYIVKRLMSMAFHDGSSLPRVVSANSSVRKKPEGALVSVPMAASAG